MFTHDLLIQSKVVEPMTTVDATITLKLEDGTKPQIKRFWEDWKFDEVKRINVPAGSTMQTVEITGKCFIPRSRAYIEAGWATERKDTQP